jgi:hypothetical protein
MTNDEKWFCRAYDYAWWRVFRGDYNHFSVLDPKGEWFDRELVDQAERWLRRHLGEKQPRQKDPDIAETERRVIADNWHLLADVRDGTITAEEGLRRYRAARVAAGLPADHRSPDELVPEKAQYREARLHRERFDREQAARRRRAAEEAELRRAQAGIVATERPPNDARAAVAEDWGRELGEDAMPPDAPAPAAPTRAAAGAAS